MMSHSEPRAPSNAGFSLLEVMISLAILALILSAAVQRFSQTSPVLDLRAQAVDLMALATNARLDAIATGQTRVLEVDAAPCADDMPTAFRFFPDGSAAGPDICLAAEALILRIRLDPLTGLLRLEDP